MITLERCANKFLKYYIADTHFLHDNIIRFDGRPFKDMDDMMDSMTKRWNNKVKNEDFVYILGDFCWSAITERWIEILDSLNGKKFLILGNHDLRNPTKELKKRFVWIGDYKETTDCGKRVIMSHYPIMCYRAAYNPDVYMLHGHVHKTREDLFVEKWRDELVDTRKDRGDSFGNIINVGCMKDYMNYCPQTLEDIIKSIGMVQ